MHDSAVKKLNKRNVHLSKLFGMLKIDEEKVFFTTVRDQKKKAEGAWKQHPTMEPGTNTVRTKLQLQRGEGGTM